VIVFMSAQPISGHQYFLVGTIGTNVISDSPATLHRVTWSGTFTGTAKLHDSATAAGTSAVSNVITIINPTAQTTIQFLDLGIQCKNGIVCEATGTPVCTVVWDK